MVKMDAPATLNLQRLEALEPAATRDAVINFYDSLPPVPLSITIGSWRGSEIATGHAFDGLLGPSGWHGKSFRSGNDVDPLVFRRRDGRLFAGNPAMMPLPLLTRFPRLARHPLSAALFRGLGPLLGTSKPRARLRMTEYRGVVSATMVYDALPIHDVFRLVDQDTMLGAMDIRGYPEPFFFVLRREVASA
jgi:hypothetical protein